MFPNENVNAAAALKPSGFELPPLGADLLSRRALKPQRDRADEAGEIRALTLAVRRGEADAFSRFYDLYSFRLYQYLLVLTRGDEHDAREVCQAVFIKLTKRFQAFDEERQLWAWLCTLAKNCFIDHCRARQRRQRLVPLDDSPSAASDGGRDSAHQLSELLQAALAGLPSEERELLQAAYVDERPLQELADASGQTYKAVESRLARLRRKLKEQLLKNLRHENQS